MARAVTEVVEDELPHRGVGNLGVHRARRPRTAVVDVVRCSSPAELAVLVMLLASEHVGRFVIAAIGSTARSTECVAVATCCDHLRLAFVGSGMGCSRHDPATVKPTRTTLE
jgi:hypothetical protein